MTLAYLVGFVLFLGLGIYAGTQHQPQAWSACWLLAIICFWGMLLAARPSQHRDRER